MDDQRPSPDDQPLTTSSGEHDAGDMHDADESPAMTPDMEAELPEAGAVPPGYDWPTHGGYLGCLLGILPACLIAGFLSSTFVAWPWFNGKSDIPPVVSIVLIVALFVVCVYGFGRIGWVLGRRFYRRYPRSEPTWGEDDNATAADAAGTNAEGSHATINTASEEISPQATQ